MTFPTEEQVKEVLGLTTVDEGSQVEILEELANVLVRAAFLLRCLAELRKEPS